MLTMLASLPLLAAAGIHAGEQMDVCASETPMMAAYLLQDGYDMPAGAAQLMLDVSTDGTPERIDHDIHTVSRAYEAAEVQHWLDLALYTAVLVDRADTAELLIRHGANVNARPEYPNFSAAGMAWAKMSLQTGLYQDHIYKKVTELPTGNESLPVTVPMLEQAAQCSHVATLKVLLAHDADMYPIVGPDQNGFKDGILRESIIDKNENSIEMLLDHGYDPCRDGLHSPHHLNDVTIAKRVGLSALITERLVARSTKCQAPAAASSTH